MYPHRSRRRPDHARIRYRLYCEYKLRILLQFQFQSGSFPFRKQCQISRWTTFGRQLRRIPSSRASSNAIFLVVSIFGNVLELRWSEVCTNFRFTTRRTSLSTLRRNFSSAALPRLFLSVSSSPDSQIRKIGNAFAAWYSGVRRCAILARLGSLLTPRENEPRCHPRRLG